VLGWQVSIMREKKMLDVYMESKEREMVY
jgi:hypothetical protein